GGFPDLPMMEDFELVRRLRKLGKVAIAPQTVITSDRRWRTLGILRTTLVNQAMVIGYLLGVDPHKLTRWYRHLGKPHLPRQ
ncbi:MAG TPA: glycosyltransferase, partial [Nodosilinea sp.]|nr:glycosyltransferase [Nodosilinea sp.]